MAQSVAMQSRTENGGLAYQHKEVSESTGQSIRSVNQSNCYTLSTRQDSVDLFITRSVGLFSFLIETGCSHFDSVVMPLQEPRKCIKTAKTSDKLLALRLQNSVHNGNSVEIISHGSGAME